MTLVGERSGAGQQIEDIYRKVASSNVSRFVTHLIFKYTQNDFFLLEARLDYKLHLKSNNTSKIHLGIFHYNK